MDDSAEVDKWPNDEDAPVRKPQEVSTLERKAPISTQKIPPVTNLGFCAVHSSMSTVAVINNEQHNYAYRTECIRTY